MLQDGAFMPSYKPYCASGSSSAKPYVIRQSGSYLQELAVEGILLDIVETVAEDYSNRRGNWEHTALSCSIGFLNIDERELDILRSEPLPLAEEFDRLAHQFGDFEEPPMILIADGATNPKNNFSPLGFVEKEGQMTQGQYRTKESLWEVYITTLIADRVSNIGLPSSKTTRDILDLLKIFKLARRWTYTDLGWSTALVKRIPESVSQKALIASREKYLGLAPDLVKPGDSIVILSGVEVPLILRKDKTKGTYKIIGEACM